jgi:predicted nucleotidyltransferase
MTIDPRLHRIVAAQPYPLLFATISGAHLYGFPSPDSDFDLLLTGIHLMRTGEVEANLLTLNEEFRLPYVADLVARKLAGPERSSLADADIAFHESEYRRLRADLPAAHETCKLPELPSAQTRAALDDLLVRVRTKGLAWRTLPTWLRCFCMDT